VWRYALAVGLAFASLLLRAQLVPWDDTRAFLLLPLTAACLAAWLGGAGPGWLATALMAGTLVLSGDFSPRALEGPGMLLGAGLLLSALFGAGRRGSEQFRELEERLAALGDCSPAMLWVSGPDGKRTYFNASWTEFTGRPLHQLLGDRWAECIHPEDTARYWDAWRAALKARRPFEVALRLRHQDGSYHFVVCRAAPRYGPDGSFLGYVGSCIDMTERHQIERELRGREEALQAAARRKDQALAALSHEWRTPLAALVAAVAGLRLGLSEEVAAAQWDIVERQVDRLSALGDELLDAFRSGVALAPRPETLQPASVPRRTTQGPRLRLLVIEDNADTATALAEFLERVGHEVEVAHDGVEGYEAAVRGNFDAILCDIGLPGMTGYEVARALHAREDGLTPPLLAISGYGEDEDRQRTQEAGFDLHLTKPINPNHLLDVLMDLLRRKGGKSPLKQASAAS
jgi:PAS domain S-box-containing protein